MREKRAGGGVLMAMASEQVLCRLVTRLGEEWKVDDSSLSLPVNLKRYGLSEVVNMMLQRTVGGEGEEQRQRPFDFLVDGEILRSSLQEVIERRELSMESVLEIEYIPAVLPPRHVTDVEHEDWVSSVDTDGDAAAAARILSGSYDGVARMWSRDGVLLEDLVGHQASVTSVSMGRGGPTTAGEFAATGSKDGTSRLWRIEEGGSRCMCVVSCHDDAVEAVSISPALSNHVATGGWDSSIYVWEYEEEEDVGGGEPAEKRIKRAKGKKKTDHRPKSLPMKASVSGELQGHTQCVSALAWRSAGQQIISGSWDNSVRIWDVGRCEVSHSVHTGRAVFSVAQMPGEEDLIAFGGASQSLRFWDSRSAGGTVVSLKNVGTHEGWISSVSWKRGSPVHVLTTSHDGTARVWDIRCSLPLHVMKGHRGKVLCGTWVGSNQLASGGEDGMLRLFDIDI